MLHSPKWTVLLCLSLSAAVACSGGKFIEKPPTGDAKTIVYVVHDDERAFSARLVAIARILNIVELEVRAGSRSTVTAFEYNKDAAELGLAEGTLEYDSDGPLLPVADQVYQARPEEGIWELLAEVPSVPSGFRVRRTTSPCSPHLVRRLEALEPQRVGTIRYGTDAVSVSRDAAFLHFPGEKLVSFREDLSRVEMPLPRFPQHRYVQTGTVVVGDLGGNDTGCVGRQRLGEPSRLQMDPWFCTERYSSLVPGYVGDFALISKALPRTVSVFERGQVVDKFNLSEWGPDTFTILLRGQLFASGDANQGVGSLENSGFFYSEGLVATVSGFGVVGGRLYAGASSGEVFARASSRTWQELGNSGLEFVDIILETPKGFLALGGAGQAAEHLSSGWCPVEQFGTSRITHVTRLGSGFLLFSAYDQSVAWVDVGL